MPERIKFTASRVGSLPIQAKEYAVWDEATPGFGVRVYPSGQRRYVYRYRAGASRSAPARMVTIGDVRKLGWKTPGGSLVTLRVRSLVAVIPQLRSATASWSACVSGALLTSVMNS
jgi:hypothetical protein